MAVAFSVGHNRSKQHPASASLRRRNQARLVRCDHSLHPIVHLQLVEDMGNVSLDGCLADEQFPGKPPPSSREVVAASSPRLASLNHIPVGGALHAVVLYTLVARLFVTGTPQPDRAEG